ARVMGRAPARGHHHMTGQQEMFPRHVGYGGKKAAEIVGISYRQLDYWARTDLVRPSLVDAAGSGSRRKYSYQDLLELKVIKSLLDAGIRLDLVREVFTYLRDQLGEDPASANLVISGEHTVLTRDGEEMIDLVRKGQGVLNILPLSGVVEEVDAAIVQLFPEAPATPAGSSVEVAAEQ
ncbi:MAG: MerR family transcriptional regulator, partial [Acidimicrobiales bacterium]